MQWCYRYWELHYVGSHRYWDLVLARHRFLAGMSVHKIVIVLTYCQVRGHHLPKM
jgi:hypothetical protein